MGCIISLRKALQVRRSVRPGRSTQLAVVRRAAPAGRRRTRGCPWRGRRPPRSWREPPCSTCSCSFASELSADRGELVVARAEDEHRARALSLDVLEDRGDDGGGVAAGIVLVGRARVADDAEDEPRDRPAAVADRAGDGARVGRARTAGAAAGTASRRRVTAAGAARGSARRAGAAARAPRAAARPAAAAARTAVIPEPVRPAAPQSTGEEAGTEGDNCSEGEDVAHLGKDCHPPTRDVKPRRVEQVRSHRPG